MGWLDNFKAEYEKQRAKAAAPKGTQRPLTNADYIGWESAAFDRPTAPAKTLDRVKRDLMNRNRVKWNRMAKEFEFFQKQMEKMGYNPEDVRFML